MYGYSKNTSMTQESENTYFHCGRMAEITTFLLNTVIVMKESKRKGNVNLEKLKKKNRFGQAIEADFGHSAPALRDLSRQTIHKGSGNKAI